MRYTGENKEDVAEKHHCSGSKEKGDRQTGGTDERNLRVERAGQVVLWMPHHFTRNGIEECGEKGQELGRNTYF